MSELQNWNLPLPRRALVAPLTSGTRRWIGMVCGGSLTGLMMIQPRVATAQPALQNAIAMNQASDARYLAGPLQDYTFKSGDFRLLLVPSFRASYNDNINLANNGAQEDFILSPLLTMAATYPLTAYNVLNLNVGVGYDAYLEHPQFSTWRLQSSSGSGLSFDMRVKDFKINLHDSANYTQDGAQQTTVAQTAQFGLFQNTAGLLVAWNLNDVVLSLGYDHVNLISPHSTFQSLNQSSEEIASHAGFNFNPTLNAGVEVTGTFTKYDQQVLNNNDSYSFGLYAVWQPGNYFFIRPRVGYTLFEFQQTSISNIQTANLSSYYFDLSVTHHISDAVSYTLSVGHETRLGTQSDAVQDWYVRPSINWNIIRNVGITTSFNYEHGNQGAGNVTGNLTETYDYYGTDLELSYPIMKRMFAGLNYRLTVRSSNANVPLAYTQNMVGVNLTYRFQ